MTEPQLKVGQTLCVAVENWRGPPTLSEAEVARIGRRWAHLSTGRRVELIDDDGDPIAGPGWPLHEPRGDESQIGRAWLSRADYESDARRRALWAAVADVVRRRPPDHLTEADARAIAELLGLAVDEVLAAAERPR